MFGEFKIQAGDFDTIRKGMFSGGGVEERRLPIPVKP
jgi:hypothetical protein